MKYCYCYLFLSFIIISCASQDSPSRETIAAGEEQRWTFETIKQLPAAINESSGMIRLNNNLWTHNDSGNGTSLYAIDTLGNLVNTFNYNALINTDWESIDQDEQYIYIADTGNNRGNRTDLKVLKLDKSQLSNEDLIAQELTYNYPEQSDFTIRPQAHPYDAEALLSIDNSLYIFTKNWQDFTTTIYELDKNATNQNASALQTININGLITDAAFNDENTILLTGYDLLLQPFIAVLEVSHSSSNTVQFTLIEKIDLPIESAQIEAIAFYEKEDDLYTYYLTSEAVNVSIGANEVQMIGEFYKFTIKL